jgi:biopolymer transport protein ExbD
VQKKTPAPRAMKGNILSILLGCGLGLSALAAQAQAPAATQPAQNPPAQTQPAQDSAPAKDAAPAKEAAPAKAPAKEAPKPAAKEAAKPAAKEAPKDATKDAAKEAPKDATKDATKDAAKEAPKDANKDAAKPADKDAAKDGDKAAAKEGDKPAAAADAVNAKNAPRGPVVVDVFPPAKGAQQPQFAVGDDKTRLDGRQLALALGTVAKDKARGPMTPVAVLVDANMSLAELNSIVTLANQAGMKQIRFFVADSERTMVTEVVPQAGAAFPRGRLESEVMAAPKEPD